MSIRRLPAALGVVVVGLQIAYPLADRSARHGLSVAIVGVFAAAMTSHAALTIGARRAGVVLASTTGLGFAVEVLGVHTGFPFGRYTYSTTLGWTFAGVPVIIAFAWTMLAWPAALAARRLVDSFGARVLVGAWALASWDLFLDPQMVAAGHWTWTSATPHLPGVDTVPISNYLGWLGVAVLMSLLLQGVLDGQRTVADGVPVSLYLWTYASSVLALGAFLGLPAAAAWGGVGMGLVAVPLVLATAGSIVRTR